MAKLRKRGNTYYADIHYQGQRRRVSLGTSDREVAKQRLRDAELDTPSHPTHKTQALAVACDEMVALKKPTTRDAYKLKVLHLCRLFGGDADIGTLTRAAVSDYTATRTKEGASRHTIHKELVVLRQTLKEAQKRGLYAGSLDVVPSWQADYQPKTRALSVEEFALLLANTPVQHRTWIMLQAYTSSNLSETAKITWEHVDLARNSITIPGTKRSSRLRSVPIHPELKAWLKGCDKKKPLVAQWKNVKHALPRYAVNAGIGPVTTNDLRRTFGSWLKQAGVDSLHVAHLMGHRSTAMVDRVYGQLSVASYSDAVNRLPPMFTVPNASQKKKATGQPIGMARKSATKNRT